MMTKEEIDNVLIWGNSHTIPHYQTGPTKFDKFKEIRNSLKGELYWYALIETHLFTDNRFGYRAELKEAFRSIEPGRNTLMNDEERTFFEGLPETITIYRGMTEDEFNDGDYGVSWTLKKETAEYFAHTYSRNYDTNHLKKIVQKLDVRKNDVIAFLNRRPESEILYLHPPVKSNDVS